MAITPGGKTYSTDGPECPYCRHAITPDESHYYDENRYTEQDCPACGKLYSVEVYIQTSWSCRKKDATDA